jgi:hypothetical protein
VVVSALAAAFFFLCGPFDFCDPFVADLGLLATRRVEVVLGALGRLGVACLSPPPQAASAINPMVVRMVLDVRPSL